MFYGVYVIRDTGSEECCLPFFVQTDVVAKRQFVGTLRTLPPSCRSDFQLEKIGEYDSQNQELNDNGSCQILSIGSDDDIKKMMELDIPFYARGGIDRAPVSAPLSSKDGSHE